MDQFSEDASAEVGESSIFRLRRETVAGTSRDGLPGPKVRYLKEGVWISAREEDGTVILPSDVFNYTISGEIPVIEADALIAFTYGDAQPDESSVRNVNIHLW